MGFFGSIFKKDSSSVYDQSKAIYGIALIVDSLMEADALLKNIPQTTNENALALIKTTNSILSSVQKLAEGLAADRGDLPNINVAEMRNLFIRWEGQFQKEMMPRVSKLMATYPEVFTGEGASVFSEVTSAFGEAKSQIFGNAQVIARQ